MSDAPLLDVRGLRITYAGDHAPVRVLDGIDLQVRRGERLGIVGESGSGKSQLLLAAMGLLPSDAQLEGSVRLDGRELIGTPERELAAVRGARMAMVFQDPMTSLNPYLRISVQLAEVLERHLGLRRGAAVTESVAMLDRLGIADAASRIRRYPHEFSGGMRQRVMIGAALLAKPALLLADEPTTALDVTVQAQILRLLVDQTSSLGTGLVLVTHDLGVVARVCERVVVLQAGRIVETGAVDDIFARPQHPYTRQLLAATPRLEALEALPPHRAKLAVEGMLS